MLQTFHQKFTRPPWFIPICAAFSLFVAVPGICLGADAQRVRPAHTSEEIYRGLVLAHGPVAELIPEIRDHLMPSHFTGDIRVIHAIELFQDQLIDAIKDYDPRFFGSFGAGIRSGDHLRIQESLERAAGVTVAVLKQMVQVKAVSRALRDDPEKLQALVNRLKRTPGAENVTEAELLEALEAVVAHSVDETAAYEDPYTTSASIVAVLSVVAVLVAAITVVAAASYAVVINVAGAAVVSLAILVWTSVYSGSTPKKKKAISGEWSLLGEQMIDSVALTLAQ